MALKKVAIYYGYPSLVSKAFGNLMKAASVFYKFDYVDRKRQNEAFQMVHRENLKMFVNAHKPEEIFDSLTKPKLEEGDLFLFEDFAFSRGQFQDPRYARIKSDKLDTYRRDYKIEIIGVSTFEKLPAFVSPETNVSFLCAEFLKRGGPCISGPNYSASNNELFYFQPPRQ